MDREGDDGECAVDVEEEGCECVGCGQSGVGRSGGGVHGWCWGEFEGFEVDGDVCPEWSLSVGQTQRTGLFCCVVLCCVVFSVRVLVIACDTLPN